MDVKCKNCKAVMENQGKIAFGSTWYYKYVCPVCNTSEHRVAEAFSLSMFL